MAVLIAAATIAVVEPYPRLLMIDESTLLYEARRILEGDVPYRDFFTIFAPGSEWLLAALFGLFGTTLETARHAMAVCHALIASAVFLVARAAGVRPTIAVAAAAVHPAVAVPQFTGATPHWFGTALLLALVGCLMRLARRERMMDAVIAGIVAGTLLVTEHPKGLVGLAGTGVVLCSARRATGAGAFARQLVAFGLGVAATAGIAGVVLATTAGWRPVYEALVALPATRYHGTAQNRWALPALLPSGANPFEPHPGVDLLSWVLTVWMPFVVIVPLARVVGSLVRRRPGSPIAGVLAVAGLMAIAAVGYNPNPVHLATILPVLLVVGAESAEVTVGALERRGWRRVGWVAVAFLVVVGLQAAHFPLCRRRGLTAPYDTAFGRLDGRPGGAETQARLEAAFAEEGRTVFVYPACPGLYLTAGLRNPTPFQLLLPHFDPPEHFAEAVAALERTQAPLVLRCWVWFPLAPDDPVLRYLGERYQPAGRLAAGELFRRTAPASARSEAARHPSADPTSP